MFIRGQHGRFLNWTAGIFVNVMTKLEKETLCTKKDGFPRMVTTPVCVIAFDFSSKPDDVHHCLVSYRLPAHF